ncbi:serine/threonine-protein phosphatase 2A activator isoform e [Chytridium lagenaria]|nr:serine/threonine-protein phosphatase 2A activator isoform e [Chytridium lagenaria]
MGDWVGSEAMVRYLQFLSGLNEAARNKKNTDECHVSETVQNILRLLDTLKEWIADIPPIATPMRFGNRAFKTWHTRLEERAEDLHKTILPFPQHTAIPELIPYFSTSFGHHIRLDYGSGHEMCFLAWLCCLNVMDVIKEVDFQAVVCRYLDLVRAIQTTYMLEPAGSHGVWGLDDYQFLPYLFGSAQLMDHPRLKPKSVLQKDSVDHFSKDFLYFRAIQFINEVKKGPFFEHSPILYDISVNTGMIKMYFAEVLQKFPVVQHIPFGSLLPFTEALPITEAAETIYGIGPK